MSIRFRLRSSSSNSTDKCLDEEECDETFSHFGQCNLCGQNSIKEGSLLLTCTVCATQYHPACLDLKSKVFTKPYSKAFKSWNCRDCRRCLLCRKKKVKVIDSANFLLPPLRSHRNKTNLYDDMIVCTECDSSIHTSCFYNLLQQRNSHSKNTIKLTLREIRNQKKNFKCDACNGTELLIDKINDESDEELYEDFDEESVVSSEDLATETSESTEIDFTHNESKQIRKLNTLKNHLKHLGILNVEEHINHTNEIGNVRLTRSNKKCINLNTNVDIKGDKIKSDTNQVNSAVKRKLDNTKNNPVNHDVPTSPECTEGIEYNKVKPKKRKGIHKSIEKQEKSKSNTGSDGDHADFDVDCPVSGCNSKGHLSGAFDTHSTVETCPLYHNLSVEQCMEIYRKRLEKSSNSLNKINRCKKSSSSNKSRILRSPDKNAQTWNSIMEIRNRESREVSQHMADAESMTMTSSRQPDLTKFAPTFDLDLFMETQSRTAELIHHNCSLELSPESDSENKSQKGLQNIVFGKYEIGVWYSSPYSNEFQSCLKLFICEFCLKCMNSSLILKRHKAKCPLNGPPGVEIYKKDSISFFEIDGDKEKEYCQNLCLLAKLFLDYKTLFFDVEPFLFYVMTESDSKGKHIVGYFSKEKFSVNNYNVSCILTFPPYQRHGYGRMLIDFSYLLTRAENKVGSPEKPLSDLGLISYRSYWKFVIMDYMSTFEGKNISLKNMSQQTGINSNDIVSTLQLMELLKYWKGKHIILQSDEIKNKFTAEVQKKKKLYADKEIDPKCLCWVPTVFTPDRK